MMPNTFDSNAKPFGNLMLSLFLRGDGLINARSGSIQRKAKIPLAIQDTTDPFVMFSVRMERSTMGRQFVEGRAEHPQERIVMSRQFVQRRAQRSQERITSRPIV